ncbi:magnesium transporter MRS2-3-like [Coffea eugenioides]|uniref:magnesium transporter MRS2-3-like n=1 Tax=Coffea eugenioides TaxID=49369 RepID=UPI000F60EE7A|nr:magnesium transporter MRS2-3-like [Coffea eugenioides]
MADIDNSSPLGKKPLGVRPWLLFNSSGQSHILEAGKHAIMRRTGITGRDLRILDPDLSYPCTISGRERAIIFSVENIKAVIMAHEVLLLNSKDPAVAPFAEVLCEKILNHHDSIDPEEVGAEFGGENLDDRKRLPLEFVVLEACLEEACTWLDNEAVTLEEESYPALDELTSNISTLNMERVHQFKSRLIGITNRVQKVKDELERLLDDDDPMSKMYLTENQLQQQLQNYSAHEDQLDDKNNEVILSDVEYRTPADNLTENSEGSTRLGTDLLHTNHAQEQEFVDAASSVFSRKSQATYASSKRSDRSKRQSVKDLEMLLEAFFVRIDATLNGLSTLREYVDDTEDYINIMLDDKLNNMMEMVIKLMTATVALTCFMIVDSVLAINIHIDLFNDNEPPNKSFLWMICAGSFGTICIYIIAMWLYRYKGLLH